MKKTYSIKDIERLSGIKAHTIRIWEKRYGILNPLRTDSNIRYYSNDDLVQLLNIAILNNYGLKISEIVEMGHDEMRNKIIKIGTAECDEHVHVESLMVSMVEYDEERFEKIISICILRMGFEDTALKVIYPFFQKLGILWQIGSVNPAQEHFISNLVRQKLVVAIDNLGFKLKDGHKNFLLFLPEGELHELGLLFYNYLIRKAGHKALYLGQSIPIDDAQTTSVFSTVDYVVTSFFSFSNLELLDNYLKLVMQKFPTQKVILTNRIKIALNVSNCERFYYNLSFEAFKVMLNKI